MVLVDVDSHDQALARCGAGPVVDLADDPAHMDQKEALLRRARVARIKHRTSTVG